MTWFTSLLVAAFGLIILKSWADCGSDHEMGEAEET